jgi:hypothetical protein
VAAAQFMIADVGTDTMHQAPHCLLADVCRCTFTWPSFKPLWSPH